MRGEVKRESKKDPAGDYLSAKKSETPDKRKTVVVLQLIVRVASLATGTIQFTFPLKRTLQTPLV